MTIPTLNISEDVLIIPSSELVIEKQNINKSPLIIKKSLKVYLDEKEWVKT